jgi:hypothetical protein
MRNVSGRGRISTEGLVVMVVADNQKAEVTPA